jgi:hypothetical protein
VPVVLLYAGTGTRGRIAGAGASKLVGSGVAGTGGRSS